MQTTLDLLKAKGFDDATVEKFRQDAVAGEAGNWWFAREVKRRPDGLLQATYRAGTGTDDMPERGLGGVVIDGGTLTRRMEERDQIFARYGRENAIEGRPNLADDLL